MRKEIYMTMSHFIAVVFLLMACLAGCGKEEEAQYFEIRSEETPFFDVAEANRDVYASFLNMQFYQDEPVQIWAVYDGPGGINVYLYKMDGNRELLLKDVPKDYRSGGGYIDREGNYYYWAANQGSIVKADSSGKMIFSKMLSESDIFAVERMYQLEDGRVYVLCTESSEGGLYRLGELDSDTGKISKISNAFSSLGGNVYVAAGENGLYYLNQEGICSVNADDGTSTEVWLFRGTTYDPKLDAFYPVWDFRIRTDGSVDLLQAGDLQQDRKGAKGVLKTLRKVPIETEKERIVLRGTSFANDKWLKECVALFNAQNEEFYIVLEECGMDLDLQQDYARQTSIEIAAGKGPDILYADVLGEFFYGVFEKGGYADLSPYLESSGIRKEDFFPWVFGYGQSDGKVYGILPSAKFLLNGHGGVVMDAGVLGGSEEPDIETLTNALLARQEKGVFLANMDSMGMLKLFLKGSEDLWGMVDWRNGNCDFDTELFSKILEAAKRYGDDGREDAQPLAEDEFYLLYQYLDKGLLEDKGKVRVGILFDDGCHANICADRIMMVNANSVRKEGAWRFISFLMERQWSGDGTSRYPGNREAFAAMMKKEQKKELYEEGTLHYAFGKENGFYPLTQERIAQLEEILEDARFVPIGTQPILDIICQEAAAYFDGTKGIGESVEIINNRVQVYLDEL